MEIKEKGINTLIENNRITINIKENSDLSVVYCFIKNLIKRIELIPESIYLIKGGNTKIKKSLNMFKNIDFWEFIDIKEESENSFVLKSEDRDWKEISGWEVRFKINPNQKDLELIIERSLREGGELINSLKKINDK